MNAYELEGKDWTCDVQDVCPRALFIACLLLSCGLILSFAQKVAMSQQNRGMRQSKNFLAIQSADGKSGGSVEWCALQFSCE